MTTQHGDVGPLLEAAEEARDLLREIFKPGTDEYNLSWALEGAIDLARSRGGGHGMSWIEPGDPPLEGGRFSLQNASDALEQWIRELGE